MPNESHFVFTKSVDISSKIKNFYLEQMVVLVVFDGWSKIYSTISSIKYNPLGDSNFAKY